MLAFARSIVETVRHPLLILDAGQRVVAANAPFYEQFAATRAETEGRLLFDLPGGPWNTPTLRTLLDRLLPGGGHFEGFELDHAFPGRGLRHLVLNGRVVRHEAGGEPVVLLALEDDTDKQQARVALERLNDELERRVAERTAELLAANSELAASNRELEAFCYSVSHDLRTPLRAIDGFSQELLSGYADRLDDRGRHYLNRVRAGTQRMGRLIDDLLALSRIGRAELRRERLDLTALAESVAAALRHADPGRAVAFAAEPGLVAHGDPQLLRLVLENLLGNAWKFTSRNAQASVTVGREPDGRRAFFVRDDGAGFDPRFADKLFGAFQRLHPEREFPGTGIGLATVQRIVRRHGGEVRAEGAVGRGATFSFTLPDPAPDTGGAA